MITPGFTFSSGDDVTAARLNALVADAVIQNGVITSAMLQNNAVTAGKIFDGAVSETKLANLAVSAAKIADLAIATAKLANLAVTEAKLANLGVTTGKIADLAVTEAKLANLGVSSGKIANNAVTTGKIQDGAVTSAKLGAGAVAFANLLTGIFPTASAVKTDTQIISGGTPTAVTGLSFSITPPTATSKILVLGYVSHWTTRGAFWLYRGAGAVAGGAAAGSRSLGQFFAGSGDDSGNLTGQVCPIVWMDSPATTSPVTYSIFGAETGPNTLVINRTGDDTDASSAWRVSSAIFGIAIP